MSESKTFQIAVLVSVVVHSVFLISLPSIPFTPTKRSLEKLKITYYEVKKKAEPIVRKLPDIKKEEILKPLKPVSKEPKKVKSEEKEKGLTSVKEVKEKEFEKVIAEEKDDARKATYISYYKAVREKIRQFADRNYPKNRVLGEGEVFLSFVVASSGELLRVRVVNERSSDNSLLRNIAINSIRDACPFPPFPKGMNQYQITFNVVISFELDR